MVNWEHFVILVFKCISVPQNFKERERERERETSFVPLGATLQFLHETLCFIFCIELKHMTRGEKIRYKIRLAYSVIKYLIL